MTQTKPRLYIEGRGFVCSGCYRRLVLTPILLKAELMASKSALIATNREEVDSNGR